MKEQTLVLSNSMEFPVQTSLSCIQQTVVCAYTTTCLLQNELLTYLWYLNLGCTLRGLGVIQKFNNDNNDD